MLVTRLFFLPNSKRSIYVVLFLLSGWVVSAQNKATIDSLKKVLLSSEILEGEEKVKIYLQLAKLHRRNNPEEHLYYAQKTFEQATLDLDKKMQGVSTSEIASHYHKADQYDSAYYYYQRSIDYFENDKNIGTVYSRMSNVEKARGNYTESIALLITSDSLFENANFNKGRLASNTNLGILLSITGDYKGAISYYKRAENFLTDKDDLTKSIIYINYGITYNELEDLNNSKYYTEESIKIKEEIEDINGLAIAYSNLSAIASKENDESLSVRYLEQALTFYQQMNNKNGVAGSYNSLGEIFRKNGDFAKAESYLLQANIISEETKNHEALLENHESLYLLYNDAKQWDKAYRYLSSYTNLKDSITEIEKIKITKELQTKYETDRILKDKKLAEANTTLAEQKAATNKNFAVAMGALGGLILAIGLFVVYRLKAKKRQEVLSLQLNESEKRLRLEQQTRISELKALQSQMNPHFVFNALNSIQDLILLQDIRNSNKYLGKFSDLIRRILSSSNNGVVSISEEIIMLKLYAELEQLRFGRQLQITFENEVPEEILDEFTLPAMFVQPYVENGLKHGLLHKEGDKRLKVHFYREDANVICCITDNGVGRAKAAQIKENRPSTHLGFSSQANQERVALINAGRSSKIVIEIRDVTENGVVGGTRVLIRFPIYEFKTTAHELH